MKRIHILSFVSLIALIFSGCATHTRWNAPSYTSISRNVALSVTVSGSLQPTAAQFAAIRKAIEPQLKVAGLTLVDDLKLASRVIRINFTPNPDDPEASGRATVLGFRTNPHAIYAGNTRANTGASYSYANGFYSSYDPFHNFDRYDRYNSYYDSYSNVSYSGGTSSGGGKHSGHPNHPGNRDDCPPGSDRPTRWADSGSNHRSNDSSWSSGSSSYASMPASPSSSYSSLPTASFASSSSDSSSSFSSSSSSSTSSGGGSYSGTEVSSNTHQH